MTQKGKKECAVSLVCLPIDPFVINLHFFIKQKLLVVILLVFSSTDKN